MNDDPATASNRTAEAIFNAALELNADDRVDYLARACGHDDRLRQRVLRLLEAHEASTRFLPETPAAVSFGALRSTRVIGDYELLEEIARGGMGVVYRARQRSLDRIVAIKMILAGQFASREQALRFRAEAESAARLQHPNIVRIHETGEHEGQPYFSMDYVAGPNLGALVHEKPLPVRRAAAYVKTIAEAIHYAHEQGVLHRDLKPSNVLIDASDQPHITDFGLAKRVTKDSFLTVTGQVMGSPGFMPPEQAGAKSGKTGRPSDVYALGGILFYLVTGRAPFVAEGAVETLQQVVNAEPISPRLLNPTVPPDIATICLKCLEKQPGRRYATAHDLAEELGRFLRDEPIVARPASGAERLWRWCKRKPAIAISIAAIALLMTLIALLSTTAAVRLKEEQAHTRETLYQSYVAQARASRLSERPGRYFEAMEAISNAAAIRSSLELRNETIAALAVIDLRFVPVGEAKSSELHLTVFDPTLQLYAQATRAGDISVRRVSDQQEMVLVPAREHALRWLHYVSPDGRWLSFHSDRAGHCVWDLKNHTMVVQGWKRGVAFSPVENFCATMKSDASVLIHELDSGQESLRKTRATPGTFVKAVDPSGKQLACFHWDLCLVEVVDLQSGKVTATMNAPATCDALAWSDDGRMLAGGCVDHSAYIWDAESGALLQKCVGHDGEVVRIAFSHSGSLLATASHDGTLRLWDPFTGGQLLSFTGAGTYQLQFSPDDRLLGLMTEGSKFGLLEVVTHAEYRWFTGRSAGRAEGVVSSPDGGLVATLWNGTTFWDFVRAEKIGFLPERGCLSALFEPDGSGMVTCGFDGLKRWRLVTNRREGGSELRIGPEPEVYPAAGTGLGRAAMSADGRRIAFVHHENRRGAWVLDRAEAGKVIKLGDHPRATFVSISPRGEWVATGTWQGLGVKVWDARTGRLVRDLPAPDSAAVLFSPDGRWLLTGSHDYRLWKTDDWEPGPPIQLHSALLLQAMSFSPDSRLLALTRDGRMIRLLETRSARVLAEFEAPAVALIMAVCFSPDGEHLIVSDGQGQVHAWNLRRIRERLARWGLDWDTPAYAESTKAPLLPTRLTAIPRVLKAQDPDSGIPPRDSQATPEQIDLAPVYNVRLDESWFGGARENSLGNLPSGLQRLAGVSFDVRGIVQLAGREFERGEYGNRANNIVIARSCRRLHFLHATQNSGVAGQAIGRYVIHYSSGAEAVAPIVYGYTVRDWWKKSGEPASPAGLVEAWTGTNREASANGTTIRLFRWTWENPLPGVEIRSLDFISNNTQCAPFLVAITAE
jgi:serine/threonine protein kinase/WD40 repeat protein